MSFPKHALFTEEDQALARYSFALGHPARLFIARTLFNEGPHFVQDLEAKMPLVQASVSHHLRILRKLDIINVEVRRLFNEYNVNPGKLAELSEVYEHWFQSFRPESTKLMSLKPDSKNDQFLTDALTRIP